MLNFKKSENITLSVLKNAEHDVFGFLITQFLFFTFEKKHKPFRFFHDFWVKPNISESALFQREMVGLTNFKPAIGVCIVNVMPSGSVLMNFWRSPLYWSLIFCKTYKFLCNMWCVMCDARCVMFQTGFFVRSILYESRGDQRYPIWVISDSCYVCNMQYYTAI